MPGLGSSRKLLIQKGKIVNNGLYVYLLLAVYIGFLFLPVIQLIYSIGGHAKTKNAYKSCATGSAFWGKGFTSAAHFKIKLEQIQIMLFGIAMPHECT